MNDHELRMTLDGARRLRADLRDLGAVAPPPDLAVATLTATGLADSYAPFATPLGQAFVAFGPVGVTALWPGDDGDAFAAAHRARRGRSARRVTALPTALAVALTRHLAGGRRGALRFDLGGLTTFEQAVLRAALTIPRGEARPYAWVAREIGQPGAVRAVGSALGRNPIPLLIPCHRVLRSDGEVGQYALGGEAKRRVLAAEGIDLEGLAALARAGRRYAGSDTTHIFCYPTCHHARRTTAAHLVTFPDAGAARAAGYRPCRVCRPVVAS